MDINTETNSQQNSNNNNISSSPLECNICYEDSYEPVTTTCGHIYW